MATTSDPVCRCCFCFRAPVVYLLSYSHKRSAYVRCRTLRVIWTLAIPMRLTPLCGAAVTHSRGRLIVRAFIELNTNTAYQHNWHIEVLAAKLQGVASGQVKRLVIMVPPRSLKSHCASICLPAFNSGSRSQPAHSVRKLQLGFGHHARAAVPHPDAQPLVSRDLCANALARREIGSR